MKNLVLFILVFFSINLLSQNNANDSISAASFSQIDNELYLPKLDSIYKWAEQYSFSIKQQEALMEKTASDSKRIKKQWLNGIKISGNARSGNYGNSVINQVETGYSYGPAISFSLYEIASQKDLVKVYKAEEKVAYFKREEVAFEIRKIVSILYNNTLSKKNILKIKYEALNACLVHVQLAEKEFNHGAITLGEVSRVTEIYTKAQTEVEVTLNELTNYYMQLEQFCDRSFNTLNP